MMRRPRPDLGLLTIVVVVHIGLWKDFLQGI
jgi:hypothetical protein